MTNYLQNLIDWTAVNDMCGGRVVILLYCPSCFLMEICLYCRFRQFVLRGDVNLA